MNDPPMVLSVFWICKLRSSRGVGVCPKSLLSLILGPKIDPKIKQARDPQRIPFGIASGRLLDRILVDLGPNLGAMLGPSWPHVRPKEGNGVRDAPLLCCIRVKWPSWSPLGALLEPSWAPLGALLAPLGALLGPSWGLLGQFRSVLEPFGGPPQGSR